MTKRSRKKGKYSEYDQDWNVYEESYEYSGKRGKRFRRNKIDGVVGGVCAGIGDYFDLDPVIVRIITIVSFFVTGGVTFWIYMGIWVFTPKDKRAPYVREYRQARRARRKNPESPAPTTTYRDVKGKFRSLEQRLQDLEKSITSSEWQLRRQFRDLEN
jgi:phage shock protein C